MSEDLRVASGWWWLPNSPGDRLPGVLSIPPEGPVRLRTTGAFLREQVPVGGSILGQTESGPVGLYQVDPGPIWTRVPEPQVSSGVYHAWVAILGEPTPSLATASFQSVTVRFERLSDWIFGRTWFPVSMPDDKIVIDTAFDRPDLAEGLLDGVFARVELNASGASQSDLVVRVERDSWLSLRATCETPLESFNEAIRCFQAFLTFLLRAPAKVLGMEGLTERDVEGTGDQPFQRPVEILQRSQFHEAEVKRGSIWEALFQIEVLRELPDVVARWFSIWEEYRPILAVFTSTRFGRMFIEEQFLSLVQVAEGLHRRLLPGTYMSAEDYSAHVLPALKAAIPSSVESDHRDVLLSRLAFGNEFSLRSRLMGLIEALPNQGRPHFRASRRFAREVAEARNDLTHYNPRSRAVSPDLSRLMLLADHLEVLIEMSLLQAMEWPSELQGRVWAEHPAIRFGRLNEFRMMERSGSN